MNKRLIWNFEINAANPLSFDFPDKNITGEIRWESRYFWSSDQIITLHGLDNHFLELSKYQIKHRQDTYYLLPHSNYNLKMRHEKLFYKPLMMKKNNAIGYGKKIAVQDQALGTYLPGCGEQDAQALLEYVQMEGIKIQVEKEALIYKINTIPHIKLELSWLRITNQSYFSVCIESRCLDWVESISSQMIGNMLAFDYVSFLKER